MDGISCTRLNIIDWMAMAGAVSDLVSFVIFLNQCLQLLSNIRHNDFRLSAQGNPPLILNGVDLRPLVEDKSPKMAKLREH